MPSPQTRSAANAPASSPRRATSPPSYAALRRRALRVLRPSCTLTLALMTLGLLAGCGAGSMVRPTVNPISIVDAQGVIPGQETSVVVSSSSLLSATVASDAMLGVDWNVTCGGDPFTGVIAGSCGSIAPTHTASGVTTTYVAPLFAPIGGTVTITASATADPTRTASLTLPVTPLPITIALANPPAALTVNAKAPLIASVANDVTAAGVNWTVTCGSTNCGSFNSGNPIPTQTASGQTQIYTAPPTIPTGGTVTITATSVADKTRSRSVIVAIQNITTTVTPATLNVATGASATLTGTTSDPTGLGLDWRLTCAPAVPACGTITPHTASGVPATYTAPNFVPGGPVTITASSTAAANAGTPASATSIATVLPISVTVSPATVSVGTLQSTSFTAALTNDGAARGVSWTVTCGSPGACGTLASTPQATTYTAPATVPTGTTVTLTATSLTDPTRVANATITISFIPVVAVSISSPPPSTLNLGRQATLAANVQNDSAIPAKQGVTWTLTCGPNGSLCGSIAPTQTASGAVTTFTAPGALPPNPTVLITATSVSDPTKSASASVTIVAPISIAFGMAPAATITAGQSEPISAIVTNDLATGGGVTWTCMPAGLCGTFTPNPVASGVPTTYTAPSQVPPNGGQVTITGTANAAPQPIVTSTFTVIPSTVVNVLFYPLLPTSIQAGSLAPINLIAIVNNDATYAGVDWSVCANPLTCGQFLVSPAQPVTPLNPIGVQAVYAATVQTTSGQPAVYIPPTQPGTPATVAITAASHAVPTAKTTVTAAVTSLATGPALTGIVQGNLAPIVGSRVALYAAGTSGYSSASTLLTPGSGFILTDSAGRFQMPGNYTCPAQSSQLYLLATGGNAGAGPNANLALMTALGPCNSLNGSAPIVINEVTTIASLWPLAPFMSSATTVGSSAANATTGLATAFATVNNLADIHTGQTFLTTPNGNGTVPQAEINSLASLLAPCVASAGGAVGDGTPCSDLFQNTMRGVVSPTDTLRAMMNLAQQPGKLIGEINLLFGLIPARPAFQPVLPSPPNDLTIALTFVGGGLETTGTAQNRPQSSALAIDAAGNVWVANRNIATVTELTGLGAALSPSTTGPTKALAGGYKDPSLNLPQSIAIDALGNAWIGNRNGSVTELNYLGAALSGPTGYTGGGQATNAGIAIDAGDPITSPGGNIWLVGLNQTQITKLSGTNGAPLAGSPITAGNIGGTSGAIAIDAAGTVWVGDSGNTTILEYNSLNGTFITANDGSVKTVTPRRPGVLNDGVGAKLAIDGMSAPGAAGTGNVWVPGAQGSTSVAELFSTGVGGTLDQPASLSNPGPLAIDGAGNVWIASAGDASLTPPIPPNVTEVSNAGTNISGHGFAAPQLTTSSAGVGIDPAGNVWVLSNTSFSTLTEFVGAGVPVVTPLALGVQKNKLGKRP